MNWLKICALLVLTLATMRASSWVVAWALTRLAGAGVRTAAVFSNVAGFGGFLLLLNFGSLPGEPVDWAAVAFGLVVFVVCAVADLYWTPWKSRDSKRLNPA